MQASIAPDLEGFATKAIADVQEGRSVYVEGPVGAGRASLVEALRSRSASAVDVELLGLDEADAPVVALLEASRGLPADQQPPWRTGAGRDLHAAARAIGRALRDQGKFLVLRMPDSWQQPGALYEGDTITSRAFAVLNGLFASAVPIIVIADAAISASRIGFHAEVSVQLKPHTTSLEAMQGVTWGRYQGAVQQLASSEARSIGASPLSWRLAVGAIAVGVLVSRVASLLRLPVSLPSLTGAIADRLRAMPELLSSVNRLLTARRAIDRTRVEQLTGADPSHLPLLTECVGYGHEWTRVSSSIRALLQTSLGHLGQATNDDHHALARYYGEAGAVPKGDVDRWRVRVRCERLHHTAWSDIDGAEWTALQPDAPAFYWDRGRHLSLVRRDFAGAARVYEECVKRFGEDDYAWHYLGFNLQRTGQSRELTERSFRQAVSLNPDHPWWNSRLVTYLIRDGQPATARDEWKLALQRVDPDGTQVRTKGGLAYHFHLWVARAWVAAGRFADARSVLELVPTSRLRDRPFALLAARLSKAPSSLERHLERQEAKGVQADLVRKARVVWAKLLRVAVHELPLPMAETTADGERFQFAWSYRSVFLEVEVDRDGAVEWFAKDRTTNDVEDEMLQEAELPSPGLVRWLHRIENG
jgi:hypothetical protein